MKIKILNYRHKKLWAIMSLIFIGVVLLPSMALADADSHSLGSIYDHTRPFTILRGHGA
jgi:hypothetical protein